MKTLLLSLTLTALAVGAQAQTARLTLDPIGTRNLRLGYMPTGTVLRPSRPEGVTISKEPAYVSVPKYAVVKVGNGPRASIVIALDEPQGGEPRIYIDANANGDLTDDGDGTWAARTDSPRTLYGAHPVLVRASWGTPKREKSSEKYGLVFYRFPSQDMLLYYRESIRTGQLKLGSKTLGVQLIENDADGLFDKKMDADGKPLGRESRPLWLRLNDDGKVTQVDARAPFALDGKTYEATISPDGAKLELKPTTKAAFVPKPRAAAPRPALLAAGTEAPNFTCYTLDGTEVKLSDLKGKIVVLDFWATWCGPCMQTMPHVEKVWQRVKDRGDVAVIGVCVWDEKAAYERWVPQNKDRYTFPLLFDPAGRGDASIAGKLYNVSGIPTTYILDKEGKVAATLVGSKDIPEKLGGELKKLGVDAE